MMSCGGFKWQDGPPCSRRFQGLVQGPILKSATLATSAYSYIYSDLDMFTYVSCKTCLQNRVSNVSIAPTCFPNVNEYE